MTKDQILAALPGLDKAALKAISAAAGALAGATPNPTAPQPDTPTGQLFEALSLTVAGVPANWLTQNSNTQSAKLFNRHAPGMIEFLNKEFKFDTLTRVEQKALLRFTWGVLLKAEGHIQGQPPTFHSIVFRMPRTKEIFNRHFPGYLQSGLADVILGALLKG